MSFVISPIYPRLKVEIDFSSSNNQLNPTWTDVSGVVCDTTTVKRGRLYELSQMETGTATLSLLSPNGEFNPFGGLMSPARPTAYDPYILPLRQIQLTALTAPPSTGGGETPNPIFRGFVRNWRQRFDESGFLGIVDLFCVDSSYLVKKFIYRTEPNYPQETTDVRFGRVLAAAGIPSGLISANSGTGDVIAASSGYVGQSAFSIIQALANEALAVVLLSPQGIWKLQSRAQRFAQASYPVFFGEKVIEGNVNTGELPYTGGFQIDQDDTYVYNDVQVSSTVAGVAASNVTDSTSQGQYGVCSLPPIRTDLVNASDVAGMASTLLANYKQPLPRLSALSVDLKAQPRIAGSYLVLNLLEYAVQVRRRFLGSTLTTVANIDSVQTTITPKKWDMTWTPTPAYTTVTY